MFRTLDSLGPSHGHPASQEWGLEELDEPPRLVPDFGRMSIVSYGCSGNVMELSGIS